MNAYRKNVYEWEKEEKEALDRPRKQVVDHCNYCRLPMKLIHHSRLSDRESGSSYTEKLSIYYCPLCGWWSALFDYHSYSGGYYTAQNISKYVWKGILKRFELEDQQLPMQVLSGELLKHPEKIYGIHHRKMEELVKYVFESYYNCEVIHCGRTGDGGKDLIIVQSDSPILVQIKRREHAYAVEPVEPVRNLLGAMFVDRTRKGIFVTTARRFTKPALDIQKKVLTEGSAEQFELINYKSFIDIFSLQKKADAHPWDTVYTSLKAHEMTSILHNPAFFPSTRTGSWHNTFTTPPSTSRKDLADLVIDDRLPELPIAQPKPKAGVTRPARANSFLGGDIVRVAGPGL